jgi:hypothetical protein
MKRAVLLLIIIISLLLITACEDVGKSCDEHGVCTGTADEDKDTLEPELIGDIQPDVQESVESEP